MRRARTRRRPIPRKLEEPYKINSRITAPEVRLVGDNVEMGIYTRQEALHLAEQQGLDLVEISPKVSPPICKVMEYTKFKYEQKKKQKLIKTKSQKVVVKEIRFSPNTDTHDFDFKLKHAVNFLEGDAKLRVYVQFSGREVKFKERGELILLKFAQALEEHGKVEQLPKLEGKRMMLILAPNK